MLHPQHKPLRRALFLEDPSEHSSVGGARQRPQQAEAVPAAPVPSAGPNQRRFNVSLPGRPELDIDEYSAEVEGQRVSFVVSRTADDVFDVLAEGKNLPEEATLVEALKAVLKA